MPRTNITPGLVRVHGNERWRVTIPRELGGGRRYFTQKGDAITLCRQLEDQRRGAVAEYFRLGPDVQVALVRAARLLGDRAREVEAAVVAYLQRREVSAKTLGAAVEECLRSKRLQGIAHSSERALRSTLLRFAGHVGAGRPVSEVRLEDVVGWFTALDGAHPLSVSTRRGYLTDLNTLFSWCISAGVLAENPARALKRPRYVRREVKVLTVGQARALMRAVRRLEPGLAHYVGLCLFAGIRPDECAWLTPANLKPGHVEVPAEISKTGRRRLVEIAPNLRRWLALPGDLPPVNLKRRLLRVRAAAGIPWPADCLRHSFASYCVALRGTVYTAAQCGHSEQVLQQHYLETVTVRDARRFFSIVPPRGKANLGSKTGDLAN